MSNQAKLTLRPPPNVEFVQGYPGIPPAAPDRPQAAVKGTIELRLGSQGAKAQWVRIELRKLETLPGGGQGNTFYDPIGQSPVNVWQAEEEWGVLYNKDFPFFIRIPESIPPSIALEKNAGIKYELVATVCLQGKKGLFRRQASPTFSTSTPIVIDKHELHSTWPVYAQPETRHLSIDGLTLIVERTHTCYGPGDRISVFATLKSDNTSAVVLRSFEFALRETITFTGPATAGTKRSPQNRQTVIGEQRIPLNITLFGGTHHRAELSCVVPTSHTSTTVNAARHIDINYTTQVTAVLAAGRPLSMALPITMSNWPRSVSTEAVKRIGPSPNLSLLPLTPRFSNEGSDHTIDRRTSPQSNVGHQPPLAPQVRPFSSLPERVAGHPGQPESLPRKRGSVYDGPDTPLSPAESRATYTNGRPVADEYGFHRTSSFTPSSPAVTSNPASPINNRITQRFDPPPPEISPTRSRPTTATNATTRLKVANPTSAAAPKYLSAADEKRQLQNAMNIEPINPDPPAGPPPPIDAPSMAPSPVIIQPTPPAVAVVERKPWLSAEQEKEMLYKKAKEVVPTPSPPPPVVQPIPPVAVAVERKPWLSAEQEKQMLYNKAKEVAGRTQSAIEPPQVFTPSSPSPAPASTSNRWESAEQEKLRLFEKAQAAARQAQGRLHYNGPGYQDEQFSSGSSSQSPSSPRPGVSAAALLYSDAMSSINRPGFANPVNLHNQYSHQQHGSSRPPYPSAEEEKSAMRYYQAKQAVDRHMTGATDGGPPNHPVPYDNLYPQQSQSPPIPDPTPVQAMPQHYPLWDPQEPPNGSADPRSTMNDRPANGYVNPLSALAEKQYLKAKYDAEQAAEQLAQQQEPHPSMSAMDFDMDSALPSYAPGPQRPQPTPPTNSGYRPLTAAEEKARLRAQYEADGYTSPRTPPNGGQSSMSASHGSEAPPSAEAAALLTRDPSISLGKLKYTGGAGHAPPPLLPKPPVEYIQETQEEDARRQAELQAMYPTLVSHDPNDDWEEDDYFNSSHHAPPPLPPKVIF